MTHATCVALVAAAEENGDEMNLYNNYSGRGMMGQTTDGITFSAMSDLYKAIAIASVRVHDGEHADLTHDDFVSDIAGIRFDNMGRDKIAY